MQQCDLLTTALEGGSNYWYELRDKSMLPEMADSEKYPETKGFEDCLVSRIWHAIQEEKEIPIHDIDSYDKLGVINKVNIAKGNISMFKNSQSHFGDILNESWDAETADIWLQYVVMNEITFG